MLVNRILGCDTVGQGPGAVEISGHLAKSLQSALAVDGAIIYLGRYAERRPLAGLPELCQSAGAFSRADVTSTSEEELRCLSDPVVANERGIGFLACSPITGPDELPLGKVAVFSYSSRVMPVEHVDLIRATARTIQGILHAAPQ
jgi:hypothetical protein